MPESTPLTTTIDLDVTVYRARRRVLVRIGDPVGGDYRLMLPTDHVRAIVYALTDAIAVDPELFPLTGAHVVNEAPPLDRS